MRNSKEGKNQNTLTERFLDFGVKIIGLGSKLQVSTAGKIIANQLLRSGTSAGANYEEACGAESKADFIHKLQIVLKETKETLYWLRLIEKSKILISPELDSLISETKQLSNIIARSIITVKTK
jgi:four helix bundle protein